jgi:hypothetical protein
MIPTRTKGCAERCVKNWLHNHLEMLMRGDTCEGLSWSRCVLQPNEVQHGRTIDGWVSWDSHGRDDLDALKELSGLGVLCLEL